MSGVAALEDGDDASRMRLQMACSQQRPTVRVAQQSQQADVVALTEWVTRRLVM